MRRMNLPRNVSGLTLDAGPLIAIGRGDQRTRRILAAAQVREWPVLIPAGVLAQVWRGGARHALLARFLATSNVTIVALDERAARAAGELCGQEGHSDVVDASVVVCGLAHNHAVVTSDPDDLVKLAPRLPLLAV